MYTKNLAGLLIGIVLNLLIGLGRINIFTVLSLLTHEHGLFLYYLDLFWLLL